MSDSKPKQLFDLELISLTDLPDVSDTLFLENQEDQPKGKKYIVFLIDKKHYAIESKKVSEVVNLLPYTSLPNIPDWHLGIANLRGDIISIIDLHTLLKFEVSDPPKAKLIVLRSENSPSHIAFKVDKVREIVALPDDEIKTNISDKSSYLMGKVKHKSNDINILNVKEILASLKLN